jgi:hypothetical protein
MDVLQNRYHCDYRTHDGRAKEIYKSTTQSSPKAIAFDLDETIGSFSDFHSIWSRLETEMRTQDVFNAIMHLYPEFLRVGIVPVLSYIRKKQMKGVCLPIYIYTNNQCEDVKWIDHLIIYLENVVDPKIGKLFADPICAFKIRDRIIEPKRTAHEKSYNDFVQCSMLNSTDLCFIDDSYHKKMTHRRVYYIQPPPYIHRIPYDKVVDRFLTSNLYKQLYPDRVTYVPTEEELQHTFCLRKGTLSISSSHRDSMGSRLLPELHDVMTGRPLEQRVANVIMREEQKITNKIMYFVREFFFITSKRNVTRRRRNKIGKFSRKHWNR